MGSYNTIDRIAYRVYKYRLNIAMLYYLQSHEPTKLDSIDHVGLDSITPDDLFYRIASLCGKSHIFYRDLVQSDSMKKRKILAYILSILKPFCYAIYTLRLDDMAYADIDIDRSQIPDGALVDTMAVLKAYKMNLIPHGSECHCSITNIHRKEISCRIFYTKTASLLDIAKLHKHNIYFINPLEVFCSLYYLYPSLYSYTLILRDKRSHALCHYERGRLIFSVILDRRDALESHYASIENLGLILYYDFSNDHSGLEDFISIDALLGYPNYPSLELLSIAHVYRYPLNANFYPKDFYTTRSVVYTCVVSALLAFILCACIFAFDRYEYYRLIKEQDREYIAHMQSESRKKQSYTPMYLRIYAHIKEHKDLNFSIKQHYDGEKWIAQ